MLRSGFGLCLEHMLVRGDAYLGCFNFAQAIFSHKFRFICAYICQFVDICVHAGFCTRAHIVSHLLPRAASCTRALACRHIRMCVRIDSIARARAFVCVCARACVRSYEHARQRVRAGC